MLHIRLNALRFLRKASPIHYSQLLSPTLMSQYPPSPKPYRRQERGRLIDFVITISLLELSIAFLNARCSTSSLDARHDHSRRFLFAITGRAIPAWSGHYYQPLRFSIFIWLS